MKITFSQRQGQANITNFSSVVNVYDIDGLKYYAQYDHVCAVLKEGVNTQGKTEKYHRADNCFVSCDAVFMDCDNTHTDDASEWITPEIVASRAQNVKFFWINSRNNMKPKDGRTPRPKQHYYFLLSQEMIDAGKVRELKAKILKLFAEFDPACKDATRLIFGVENPTGDYVDGNLCIDECIDDMLEKMSSPFADVVSNDGIQYGEMTLTNNYVHSESKAKNTNETIKQGERNSTLYNAAIKYLANNSDEIARQKFEKIAEKCEPRLQQDEISQIWGSACKSDIVKLNRLADKVIAENHGAFNDDDVARDLAYLDYSQEARATITTDEKLVSNAWDAALKRAKIKVRAERDAEKAKAKKEPLTFRHVQEALKEDGITIQTNVITKATEVKDLPENSEFAPAGYAELSDGKKKNLAANILPDFLTPKLRSKNKVFSEKNLASILANLAEMKEYNPVAEFLKDTAWDGQDRINELCKVLGIENNPLYCTYLKKFLIQAVAMALNDDDTRRTNDFVLVLQGAQGIGKTEFFRRLAMRPEWFIEGWSYDAKDKDTAIAASKCWICEIGELDYTLKKQQGALKSYITAAGDIYRIPYDKYEKKILRHTVYGATVNDDRFLLDTSGGTRRWAIIRLQKNYSKDLFALSDTFFAQLWAEAYSLFSANASYRLNDDERLAMEAENKKSAMSLKGEDEINESLNWAAPLDEWQEKTATDVKNALKLKHDSGKIGKVLAKIASEDTRVTKRRISRGVLYLLPPFRDQNGSNIYEYEADIPPAPIAKSPTAEKRNDLDKAYSAAAEIIKLYGQLFTSYQKNKIKATFDNYVQSFTPTTFADLLKRPLNENENEKIKTQIIEYHNKRKTA